MMCMPSWVPIAWVNASKRRSAAAARISTCRSRWVKGRRERTEMHGALIEDLSQTTETLRRSTVQVEGSGRGAGSGVIWRADGAIITNAHVLRRGGAQIRLWDGRVVRCTVVARDRRFDLRSEVHTSEL